MFDPACGSGNFLVIAYRELREIENELLQRLANLTGKELGTFTNIHLKNFYGIELRDFATETARLSLYVAQFQMNERFRELFGFAPKALPLTEMGQIHGGNALRMDWEAICPPVEGDGETVDTFICGNPPYVGTKFQAKDQKADLADLMKPLGIRAKNFDYVACWLIKSAAYNNGCMSSQSGFVTTNSLFQGEQAELIFQALATFNIKIFWAQKNFRWSNNASKNAAVSCSVVGFGNRRLSCTLRLYDGDSFRIASNIGPYLVEMPDLVVSKCSVPISTDQNMKYGSMANDGGAFFVDRSIRPSLEPREREFLKNGLWRF